MFRLEVTGATLQDLYTDSTNLLLLIARGGQNITTTAQPEAPQQSQSVTDTQAPGEAAAAVVAEPNPSVAPTPPPKKERKTRTAPVTIEAKAEPVTAAELPAPVDEDPLGLDIPSPEAKPELTLDDMKARVQAILEAGKARGMEMKDLVPYVRKLFAPFNIQIAKDLKPEQFAKFWAASHAYLDGTAP